MILFSCSFGEFILLRIPLVPTAFYCSWKLHECIGKLRLLGQCLIVVTGSRWVLFVVRVCPISSLGNCCLPLQLLLWSDFWMFVLLFPLKFVNDSLVELIVLCNFSWFLLCTLLRLLCQGCVLLVILCLILLTLSIISGKLLLWNLLICFSLVLHQYSFHQLLLTPHDILVAFAWHCWKASCLVAVHFAGVIYFNEYVSHFLWRAWVHFRDCVAWYVFILWLCVPF
jgi:hypothetical protein